MWTKGFKRYFNDEPPKTFTQDEVNAFLAKEKKEWQTKNEKLVKELEELKKNTTLSEEQKSTLQKQIDEIKSNYETEADRQKRQVAEKEAAWTKEKEMLAGEAKTWRTRYERSRIARDIRDAANTHGAISADDIYLNLKDNAEIVEINDEEGKPSGEFNVIVRRNEVKDGKTIPLKLTPSEAVERMKKDTQRYGHLFRASQPGGTGGNNTPITGGDIGTKFTGEQWAEHRKKAGLAPAGAK